MPEGRLGVVRILTGQIQQAQLIRTPFLNLYTIFLSLWKMLSIPDVEGDGGLLQTPSQATCTRSATTPHGKLRL